MRKPKLITSYAQLSDANLDAKAQVVVNASTGNAHFPAPHPELDALATASAAYTGALIDAASRDRTLVSIKNEKQLLLLQALALFATWVTTKAAGDRTILISSGLDLAKVPEPQPPLPKPENVRLNDGVNPGQLLVTVQGNKLVKTYQYQYTASDPSTPNVVWHSHFSTDRKFTFEGLESGKRYWCRVNYIGKGGQEVFSDVVSRVTQ